MTYRLRMRLTDSAGQSYETLTLFNAQTEAELFELFSRFYDRAEQDPRITSAEGQCAQSTPGAAGTTQEPLSLSDETGSDRLDLFYRWLAQTPI